MKGSAPCRALTTSCTARDYAAARFRDAIRPILVNNWEATYFDFDADKIEAIAKAGSELGIELFVLDDGWFGRRDSDNSSLGDWIVDKKKLPNGLEDLAERVRGHGLEFGLWFEPEMVSPDSDLYRAHPDWCLHVPGRRRTEGRQQLILDLSRKDVQAYIVESVSGILASAPITYVKWDMNRNMSEIGSALLPAEPPARDGAPVHARLVQRARADYVGVPERAVRKLLRRRRPLRSRHAVLHAADVDERQLGRGQPLEDPVRHEHRVPG